MVNVLEKVLHYENRMTDARFYWFINIFLAVIIFYNAEIGRWVGLQQLPLAISVVWPATGFSLAALLVFGYRAWPGIFLGNVCYNFLHIYLHSHSIVAALFGGTCVTVGSVLEALFAAYLMKRYCTPSCFGTVKDVFVFLLAAFCGALIASTVGVAALYFTGSYQNSNVFMVWLTFLVGDVMGAYIFTPLLVVWSIQKPKAHIKEHSLEFFFMCLSFVIITLLNVVWDYPIAHFYMLLSGWTAYRFQMHGATLSIFLIALVTIVPTVLGLGSFTTVLITNQLLLLVTFIEIIVAISLLVAAVYNEKDAAWNLLKNQNIDLQDTVEAYIEEISGVSDEVIIKEKLISLGVLISNMAKNIPSNQKKIAEFSKKCLATLEQLHRSILDKKEYIKPEIIREIQDTFETIYNNLQSVVRCAEYSSSIAKIIQEQSDITAPGRIKAKAIPLNTLVNICLTKAMAEEAKSYPDFSFPVSVDFDKTIKTVFLFPDDLALAFIYIFKNAMFSIRQKREQLVANYRPMLTVNTQNHDESVEVVIFDNGIGVTDEQKESFFRSFITKGALVEVADLPDNLSDLELATAHDIFVYVHHGAIKVNSFSGDYQQVKILLQKVNNKSVSAK
jgi:two-component system, NtrC family, sensor kinase